MPTVRYCALLFSWDLAQISDLFLGPCSIDQICVHGLDVCYTHSMHAKQSVSHMWHWTNISLYMHRSLNSVVTSSCRLMVFIF